MSGKFPWPGAEGLRAVLFDLDGTLVDSAPDLGAAVDKMRVDRGLQSYPLERYRPMAGAGARGMLGEAFGMTPEHPDFASMREEFFVNYEACMTQRTAAFAGVPEMLTALQQRGLRWGVVTNKAERFALPLTRAMALLISARGLTMERLMASPSSPINRITSKVAPPIHSYCDHMVASMSCNNTPEPRIQPQGW